MKRRNSSCVPTGQAIERNATMSVEAHRRSQLNLICMHRSCVRARIGNVRYTPFVSENRTSTGTAFSKVQAPELNVRWRVLAGVKVPVNQQHSTWRDWPESRECGPPASVFRFIAPTRRGKRFFRSLAQHVGGAGGERRRQDGGPRAEYAHITSAPALSTPRASRSETAARGTRHDCHTRKAGTDELNACNFHHPAS